jgi:hypothetical protein
MPRRSRLSQPAARRRPTLLLAIVLAITSGACSREPALDNISRVDTLKARFNADAGKPRIILLLSPT